MKSIYIDNHLHQMLKSFAVYCNKSLLELVTELLERGLKKKVDDLQSRDLANFAMIGEAFSFLNSKDEDCYSVNDGEKV